MSTVQRSHFVISRTLWSTNDWSRILTLLCKSWTRKAQFSQSHGRKQKKDSGFISPGVWACDCTHKEQSKPKQWAWFLTSRPKHPSGWDSVASLWWQGVREWGRENDLVSFHVAYQGCVYKQNSFIDRKRNRKAGIWALSHHPSHDVSFEGHAERTWWNRCPGMLPGQGLLVLAGCTWSAAVYSW